MPITKSRTAVERQKKIIEDTLFKSYVFVHIAEEERLQVLQTDGVLNFVHYLGKPAVIKDEEINLIKSYLKEKDAVISTQSWESLEPDIRVKVKHGIFMDNTGTVLRASKKKVYVRLESLGQVMVVEFPADYLSPIQ